MATSSRIMVVEDEEVLGENIAEYVRGLGHEVALFGCAAEAIGALRELAVEVVVLDLDLAGGGADRVMDEICQTGRRAQRCVLITSRSDEPCNCALAQSAGPLISKPFALERLREALGSLPVGDPQFALSGDRP